MGLVPRTFQELLSDIAAAHQREVEALHAQLEGLRVGTAADSATDVKPSQATHPADCFQGDTNGGSIETAVADPGEPLLPGAFEALIAEPFEALSIEAVADSGEASNADVHGPDNAGVRLGMQPPEIMPAILLPGSGTMRADTPATVESGLDPREVDMEVGSALLDVDLHGPDDAGGRPRMQPPESRQADTLVTEFAIDPSVVDTEVGAAPRDEDLHGPDDTDVRPETPLPARRRADTPVTVESGIDPSVVGVEVVVTAPQDDHLRGPDDAGLPPEVQQRKNWLTIPLPGSGTARGDIPGSVELGVDAQLPSAPPWERDVSGTFDLRSGTVSPRGSSMSPKEEKRCRRRRSGGSPRHRKSQQSSSSSDAGSEEPKATVKTMDAPEHARADEAHPCEPLPQQVSHQLPCDVERQAPRGPLRSFAGCSSGSNCSNGSRGSRRMLDRRASSVLGDDSKPLLSQDGALELSKVWGELGEAAQDIALYRDSPSRSTSSVTKQPQINYKSGGEAAKHKCAQLVAAPSSRTRLAWDLAGVVFLAYDLIMVPLQVYAVGKSETIRSLNLATACFWTLDILSSFFVGYHSKGVVVMDPVLIALRYLKSWFLLDLIIVVMDWVLQVGLNSVEHASTIGRASRGMRAMRLLRVAKLHNLLSEINIKAKIRSELTRTLLGILKIIIVILILNHFVACGFYGLQYVMLDERTWVDKNFAADDSFAYRYFTSLHWSMTQFTPASMEVTPVNAIERCFAVCTLLMAMICFSSFVSSITSAMTRYGNSNLRQQQQTLALYRFLGQRGISTQLVNRVWHYLHDRQVMHSQARARESDVELFALLPDSLKVDLRYEMYIPAVSGHPLFQRYSQMEPQAVRHICKSALQEHALSIREELFGECMDVTHMVFVVDGLLTYSYPKIEGNGVEVTAQGQVSKGQWACEAALWVNRLPLVGPFVAAVSCELLLLLSVAEFVVIARRFPSSVGLVAQYAYTFVEYAKQESQDCKWTSCFCNSPEVVEDLAAKASEAHAQLATQSLGLSEWPLAESSVKERPSLRDTAKFFTKWIQRPSKQRDGGAF